MEFYEFVCYEFTGFCCNREEANDEFFKVFEVSFRDLRMNICKNFIIIF